jgi:hypothetical protein
LCHLESLVGLPALNALFAEVGDQIDLVILSNRFGGKHGGALRQLVQGVKRSGLRMTFWLGFDIVAAQLVWQVARVVTWLTGRVPMLQTVHALATRHDATIIETDDINSEEIIRKVRRLGIDVVVVMNFDQILKDGFIHSARLAVINVHPSLLPSLRGPCPVFWALFDGHQEIGATLHMIDSAEIDAGPIITQCTMATDALQSVGELTSALFLTGVGSIKNVTDRLILGWRPCISGEDPDGGYRGFPSRAQMASPAARRVRLCRLVHASSLMRAATGLSFRCRQ